MQKSGVVIKEHPEKVKEMSKVKVESYTEQFFKVPSDKKSKFSESSLNKIQMETKLEMVSTSTLYHFLI